MIFVVYWFYIMVLSFIGLRCQNKIPQTEWLIQQELIPQFEN